MDALRLLTVERHQPDFGAPVARLLGNGQTVQSRVPGHAVDVSRAIVTQLGRVHESAVGGIDNRELQVVGECQAALAACHSRVTVARDNDKATATSRSDMPAK